MSDVFPFSLFDGEEEAAAAAVAATRQHWHEPEEVRLARAYGLRGLDITKDADFTQPISALRGGARSSWTRQTS